MLNQLLEKRLQETLSQHGVEVSSRKPGAKLSRIQKSVLIWLCRRYSQIEERGEQVEEIGIRFFVKPYKEKRNTLSSRAALSRAVKSMEERGLIKRSRQGRRLCLSFTEEGRKIAQPLYEEAKAEQVRQQRSNG
jgi:DNA-binding MarR family transcriptional regulator